MDKKERAILGLRKIRSQICRFYRKEHEIHKCPCVRGATDAGHDNGAETGCKEIKDAIDLIKDDG